MPDGETDRVGDQTGDDENVGVTHEVADTAGDLLDDAETRADLEFDEHALALPRTDALGGPAVFVTRTDTLTLRVAVAHADTLRDRLGEPLVEALVRLLRDTAAEREGVVDFVPTVADGDALGRADDDALPDTLPVELADAELVTESVAAAENVSSTVIDALGVRKVDSVGE